MGRMSIVGGRPVVAGLATIALAGVGLVMPTEAAPAPSGTDVTLTSGTVATWTIVNDDGTVDGTPTGGAGTDTGGNCPSPRVPGLSVDEGDGVNNGDAFDGGLMFFVNNHEMVSPSTWDVQTDPSNPALNRVLTAGPAELGGIATTVEYRALPSQQVLRSIVSMANPSSSSVTIPFTVASNFGSDGSTVVVGSSSGDGSLSDADHWVVTADDATSPGDAVNTSVLAGPGTVAAPPTNTSMTVFDCYTRDGVRASYQITIPAGGTRSLMFFNEVSTTNAGAVSAAARFNTNPAATDELLTGLSAAQRASIVNWKLTTAQQPDGQIRRLDSKKYIGNNVYNTTGKHQTVKTRAHRGDKRTFRVKIFNDGNATATFAAHGVKSAKGLRVKYFSGGKNVTAQMNSAAGLSFTRAPGHAVKIKVKVKVKANATGHRKFAKVSGVWTGSGFSSTDTVRAVVKLP